jgi:hypothetical protein
MQFTTVKTCHCSIPLRGDGWRINFNHEVTILGDVELPDEKWNFVDQHGHVHQWTINEAGEGSLPSLKRVIDETDVDDNGEEFPVQSHLECAACGEVVKPEYRIGRKILPPTNRSVSGEVWGSVPRSNEFDIQDFIPAIKGRAIVNDLQIGFDKCFTFASVSECEIDEDALAKAVLTTARS